MRQLWLCFSILIFMGHSAQGFLGDGAHIAQSAETLAQFQWSFKPFPGANPVGTYTTLLTNSLSVGLTDRLEIGFIPLATSGGNESASSMKNVNMKLVIFRIQGWVSSLGFQVLSIKSNFQSELSSYRSSYFATGISAANSWNLGSDYRLTHNLVYHNNFGQSSVRSKDSSGAVSEMRFDSKSEPYFDNYLDLSYLKSLSNVWTLGLSRATDNVLGVNLKTEASWGIGLSHTWNIARGWLSQLTLGCHFIDDQTTRPMLGATF